MIGKTVQVETKAVMNQKFKKMRKREMSVYFTLLLFQ